MILTQKELHARTEAFRHYGYEVSSDYDAGEIAVFDPEHSAAAIFVAVQQDDETWEVVSMAEGIALVLGEHGLPDTTSRILSLVGFKDALAAVLRDHRDGGDALDRIARGILTKEAEGSPIGDPFPFDLT